MKSTFESGFTLIETVVYVALLSILLSGAIVAAFSLSDGAAKNTETLQTKEEIAFIEDKIGWALMNATSITTTATSIRIQKMTGDDFVSSDNPITLYEDDAMLLLKRGSAAPVPLNPDGFPVTAFHSSIKTTNSGKQVSVAFEMRDQSFDATYNVSLP